MFYACLKRPVLNLPENYRGCRTLPLSDALLAVLSKCRNPLLVFVVHVIFIFLCICPCMYEPHGKNASHLPGEQRVHSKDVAFLQAWVWCLWKTAFNGSEASSKLAPKQSPVMEKEGGICKVNVFSIPLMPPDIPLHLSPLLALCETAA